MSGSYWETVEPIWDKISINDVDVFLETYAQAPPHAALLYAAHFCQSEVCNGGFHQLFYNSTGVLAPEAVWGFHAIGQHKVAETVQAAMDVIGSPIREIVNCAGRFFRGSVRATSMHSTNNFTPFSIQTRAGLRWPPTITRHAASA